MGPQFLKKCLNKDISKHIGYKQYNNVKLKLEENITLPL